MDADVQLKLILKRISLWSFLTAAGIGAVSLVGRFSGLQIIPSIGPDHIPIAPSTAWCFIILSVSALLTVLRPDNAAARVSAAIGAGVIFLGCLAILIAFVLGTAIEGEYPWIQAPLSLSHVPFGLMSPINAATFLAAASGVLFLAFSREERRRLKHASAFAAAAVASIGFIIILGYMHGTSILSGGNINPVALPAAIAFVLIGLGLTTASGPSILPVRIFTGPTVQSRLMRAFFPTIVAFILIGGLAIETTLLRASNPSLIAALVEFLSILVSVIMIAKIAKSTGNRLDRALAENRLLASIVQNIPDAICAVDVNFITVAWNRGAEKMLGYAADEIIGKPIGTIIPEDIIQHELEHCQVLLNSQGAFSGYESVRLTKDGRRIPVELTAVAIRDNTQTIRNFASIMSDLTNRKKAEEERLKGHMLESIGILAGGIAHDFNNMLSVILGNVQIAKLSEPICAKAIGRLDDAEEICAMAAELSNRLLTFATGGDPLKKTMSLSGLLAGRINMMLKGSTISSEFHLPDDLYLVAIDEGQMNQVISNLVTNAKEAMPKGGTLTVRGENLSISAEDMLPIREGSYLKISIRDTGIGLPAENLAKIFDPYFTTKDTYNQKGLGLGLAVCYSVIKRHGGLITAASEVGKGTTFDIYLPAVGMK